MKLKSDIFSMFTSYGISCIPCRNKRAQGSWKQYQTSIPSPEQIACFNGPQIACICGRVSGGLVCIDFDTKNGDVWDEWQTLVNNTAPNIFSKLCIETTPSGGYHVVFRSDLVIGNEKLAKNKENAAMIETRGEGGYFVCAPSDNYKWIHNHPGSISKLSKNETDLLLSSARALNELPIEHTTQVNAGNMPVGNSPFDDYDSKIDPCQLLESHGWSIIYTSGNTIYLKRPGKKERSISASWNKIPGRFYCFTTSTIFQNNSVYKPSAIYAILVHNGDYSAAAKELYHKGYGDRTGRQESDPVELQRQKIHLINNSKIYNEIIDIKINGYQKGLSTGWNSLDKLFTIVKGQLTVITGYPSSGKSEFMDALAINLMIMNKWKFAVFSPENYPAKMHYHKLIEKLAGDELRNIEDDNIDICVKTINDNFFFIDALEEDVDLELILNQTQQLVDNKNINALILDPWNEIELSKPSNISETDFIGICLRKTRKFARKNNIHLFIIAHPTKPQKSKDGTYPIPELYDIAGSAHWRNKADNGLTVHRCYESGKVYIYVQKVKFKYCGRQGETHFYYDVKSGRYLEEKPESHDHWSN